MRVETGKVQSDISQPKTTASGNPFEGKVDGDTISARVIKAVDAGNGSSSVMLKTSDGAVFQADIAYPYPPLRPGDSLKLLLLAKNDDTISLQIIRDTRVSWSAPSGAGADGIVSMLDSLNIAYTPESLDKLIQAFAQNKLPINETTITMLSDIIQNIPSFSMTHNAGRSIDLAMFLAANHIAPDDASVISAFSQMMEAPQATGKILNAIFTNIAAADILDQQQASPVQTSSAPNAPDANVPASNPSATVTTAPQLSTPMEMLIQTMAQNNPELTQTLLTNDLLPNTLETLSQLLSLPQNEADAVMNQFIRQLPPGIDKATVSALQTMLREVPQAVRENIAAASVPGETAIDKTELSSEAALSDKMKSVFVKLTSDTGENASELKKAATELLARMHGIRADLIETGGRESIVRQADMAVNQIKTQDNILNFSYVQIPFQLKNEQRTAELYVMKRNKREDIDPNDATILVALDTQNLGIVENLIKVENKDISLQMRVQNARLTHFLKDNTVALHRLLKESGFRLKDFAVKELETPVTPVNVEKVVREEYRIASGVDVKI